MSDAASFEIRITPDPSGAMFAVWTLPPQRRLLPLPPGKVESPPQPRVVRAMTDGFVAWGVDPILAPWMPADWWLAVFPLRITPGYLDKWFTGAINSIRVSNGLTESRSPADRTTPNSHPHWRAGVILFPNSRDLVAAGFSLVRHLNYPGSPLEPSHRMSRAGWIAELTNAQTFLRKVWEQQPATETLAVVTEEETRSEEPPYRLLNPLIGWHPICELLRVSNSRKMHRLLRTYAETVPTSAIKVAHKAGGKPRAIEHELKAEAEKIRRMIGEGNEDAAQDDRSRFSEELAALRPGQAANEINGTVKRRG